MDIRNILNRYFDKTPVPDELDPRNVSKFVVPNLAEKKETQTEESYESDAYSSTDNYTVTQTSQTTPSEETLSGKKEDSAKYYRTFGIYKNSKISQVNR